MSHIFSIVVTVAAIYSLPLLIGYGRRLDHWTMTKIWLFLGLLPVAGWFVAAAIAAGSTRQE